MEPAPSEKDDKAGSHPKRQRQQTKTQTAVSASPVCPRALCAVKCSRQSERKQWTATRTSGSWLQDLTGAEVPVSIRVIAARFDRPRPAVRVPTTLRLRPSVTVARHVARLAHGRNPCVVSLAVKVDLSRVRDSSVADVAQELLPAAVAVSVADRVEHVTRVLRVTSVREALPHAAQRTLSEFSTAPFASTRARQHTFTLRTLFDAKETTETQIG